MSTAWTTARCSVVWSGMDPPLDPMHPGEVLRELWLNGTSVASAARHASLPEVEMSRLFAGKKPVCPSVARMLEGAGWGTATFWLRMQDHYDASAGRDPARQPALAGGSSA